MSEEKAPITPEEEPQPVPPKKEAPASPARRTQSVVTYLAILFAAAFLLLLLAYFMQQRTNEQTIGSLKETVVSIESLDDLIEENRALRDQLKEQEASLEAAEDQQEALSDQLTQSEASVHVLALLLEAQTCLRGEDAEGARRCLDELEHADLSALLPSDGDEDWSWVSDLYAELQQTIGGMTD